MAWDPANNGVTNIHAGYGLFYDNMRTLQNFGELTWPQAQADHHPATRAFPIRSAAGRANRS